MSFDRRQRQTERVANVQGLKILSTGQPVSADYDGDGKDDVAVYRAGVWYIFFANGTYRIENFGLADDIPAQLGISN